MAIALCLFQQRFSVCCLGGLVERFYNSSQKGLIPNCACLFLGLGFWGLGCWGSLLGLKRRLVSVARRGVQSQLGHLFFHFSYTVIYG